MSILITICDFNSLPKRFAALEKKIFEEEFSKRIARVYYINKNPGTCRV